MPAFDHVLILGPGLLGGSLGLALKHRRLAGKVSVWARRPEAVDQALQLGAADCGYTDIAPAASGVDLAILCTPTKFFPQLAGILRTALPAGAIVTDVGSVKLPVCEELEKILGTNFIGSHPMAGSEKSGIAYARADLFEGAVCIVTPTENTSPCALDAAETLWSSLGGHIHHLSPVQHDKAVARLSHLPHLLASVLAHASAGIAEPLRRVAGPGFRDTTRVASGPPEMWVDILMDNRSELAVALADFISALDKFSTALRLADRERLRELLASARASREAILASKNHPL